MTDRHVVRYRRDPNRIPHAHRHTDRKDRALIGMIGDAGARDLYEAGLVVP